MRMRMQIVKKNMRIFAFANANIRTITTVYIDRSTISHAIHKHSCGVNIPGDKKKNGAYYQRL